MARISQRAGKACVEAQVPTGGQYEVEQRQSQSADQREDRISRGSWSKAASVGQLEGIAGGREHDKTYIINYSKYNSP